MQAHLHRSLAHTQHLRCLLRRQALDVAEDDNLSSVLGSLEGLHDLMLAYGHIDVSGGTFEVFVEVNAEAGHYSGYVKPFFRDLKFTAVPDPDKNLAQRAATKVASAVTDLLKNKEGQVATKAPFEGDFARRVPRPDWCRDSRKGWRSTCRGKVANAGAHESVADLLFADALRRPFQTSYRDPQMSQRGYTRRRSGQSARTLEPTD